MRRVWLSKVSGYPVEAPAQEDVAGSPGLRVPEIGEV